MLPFSKDAVLAMYTLTRRPTTRHSVGFAGALGVELVTFDKGLARMASDRKLRAILIQPV